MPVYGPKLSESKVSGAERQCAANYCKLPSHIRFKKGQSATRQVGLRKHGLASSRSAERGRTDAENENRRRITKRAAVIVRLVN